ncbi:hypothetical protein BGZ96_003919 [Linnemannia gamsii]|uniref:Uncharacterized protein n=1 Tax=Linnemannia gamsii TaxID=64522 RepID=A0ABQ7KG35_9FUNG|nr:hypothetical protein BGZ96_003919 [Linnemannia gamsii]
MELFDAVPGSTTDTPTADPNPTSGTFVFTDFPSWTIPTRTGPLYPGRPGRTILPDLPPPPSKTNDPSEPTANPTAIDNGGVIVPTPEPGIIAPIAPIANATTSALFGGTTITASSKAPAAGITLQPGSPTSFRGTITPTGSPAFSADSYTLVPSSVTGLLFGFAIVGALIIGFVTGTLVMRYTRFGRRKEYRKEKGELTEQLRLLTDTLGHRNDRLYREEKHTDATAHQTDFLPPWYHSRHLSGMYPGPWADRLHPQSIMDQSVYQDWAGPYTPATVNSPITPGSPMASFRQHPTFRQPRVINLPPSQSQSPTAENSDVYGPKGEWSTTGASTASSSNGSSPDFHGIEKRRPQIQEEGVGEDSLFNIDHPSHNPHVSTTRYAVHGSERSFSSSGNSSNGSRSDVERSVPLSQNDSTPNIHVFEVEKRCPQIQEEGMGEDSLFDVGHPSHNPHVTGRII